MKTNIWFRILITILLAAVLLGAGVWVYHLGLVHGTALDGQVPALSEGFMPYHDGISAYGPGMHGYYPGYGMGMHMFFSPLRFIGGIFLFFLILGGFRALFFGFRGHGSHYHHGHGRWHGYNQEDVPPMVKEWHRKMHEAESKPSEE